MKKIVAFSLFAILRISFAPLTNALASPKTTNLAAPFSLTKTPTKVPTFSRTPTRTLGPTNTSVCYTKQDYKNLRFAEGAISMIINRRVDLGMRFSSVTTPYVQ